MFKKFSAIGAVAAAALMSAPTASNALSLSIMDTTTNVDITIVDGGAGDLDGAANGTISATNLSVGSASISISSSFESDVNGVSTLVLNVTNAVAGASGLYINASHTGFGEGAAAPNSSALSFVMNASNLSPKSFLAGAGFVDNANVEYSTADQVGATGIIKQTSDTVDQADNAALNDPFSMTLMSFISGNTVASYDATLIAAVPLPAGGLMLLTALGGIGIARRRRKAA